MKERLSTPEGGTPTIEFLTEYGVYQKGDVSIVSFPTWKESMEAISKNTFFAQTVLLPELITLAGIDVEERAFDQTVENAITEFSVYSRLQPDTTFVFGSPHFVSGIQKPYNGAYVLKDGEILEIAHKHMGIQGEENYFSMDEGSIVPKLGNSNILICRDIIGATLPNDEPTIRRFMLKTFENDNSKVEKLMDTRFIDPSTERLLISACWGIGLNPDIKGEDLTTNEGINATYLKTLRSYIKDIFLNNKNIREIIVSDRAPLSKDPIRDLVSSRPMSVIAHR